MRTAADWLTPVRAGGMTVYLIAVASCGVAWLRTRGGAPHGSNIARLAAIFGILDVALLCDIAFDWRWKLYDALKVEAMAHRLYDQRHGPQLVMLMILGAAFLIVSIAGLRRLRTTRGAVLALEGALLSAGCWCMEIISLHSTDSVLYHRVGPLMVINFVWLPAAMMTTIGILRGSSRPGTAFAAKKAGG
jgi:hypothetical protein